MSLTLPRTINEGETRVGRNWNHTLFTHKFPFPLLKENPLTWPTAMEDHAYFAMNIYMYPIGKNGRVPLEFWINPGPRLRLTCWRRGGHESSADWPPLPADLVSVAIQTAVSPSNLSPVSLFSQQFCVPPGPHSILTFMEFPDRASNSWYFN